VVLLEQSARNRSCWTPWTYRRSRQGRIGSLCRLLREPQGPPVHGLSLLCSRASAALAPPEPRPPPRRPRPLRPPAVVCAAAPPAPRVPPAPRRASTAHPTPYAAPARLTRAASRAEPPCLLQPPPPLGPPAPARRSRSAA
jgi:hypothetical protein